MTFNVDDKRTKIVCTIGPGTDQTGVLERMIAAGMNVARFNFSHGMHHEHAQRMRQVKDAAATLGKPIALLLDTKGPEMRLGIFQDGQVELHEGQSFSLYADKRVGDKNGVTISYPELWKQVQPGQTILLSDGLIRLLVKQSSQGVIKTEVENSGIIGNRKRVACPALPILLPALSEQDRKDILFGIEQDIDYIAASFVQRPEDVVEIKQFLESHGASHIRVIAKIENEEGIRNLAPILQIADGLMIARGDLGVEIPAERVPILQKEMIHLCNHLGKPVITATQMLESMIHNPRPTRAETSDIANAILDGTDAIMLSGETANGKYPVAAVETMLKVALSVENSEMYQQRLREAIPDNTVTTEAISHSTVSIAEALKAKAILTSSESGRTALTVSKYRPHCPIVMISPHSRTLRRAALYWGVLPVQGEATENSDKMVENAMQSAMESGVVQHGDLAVITAGVPSGREGSTNMIRVQVAGQALLKGTGIGTGRAVGRVTLANPKDIQAFREGNILVMEEWQEEWQEYAHQAGGIIAAEQGLTSASAIVGLSLGIPTIVGVENATAAFTNGDLITVDAVRGMVFHGEANAR